MYISVRDAALKWNTDERHVTRLCRDGRIFGAKKAGKFWMIPENAEMPVDGRTRILKPDDTVSDDSLFSYTGIYYTRTGCSESAINAFHDMYGKYPIASAFTPYRICPIGAHSDHNLGRITGFAIDMGIHMAFGPRPNGIIELRSLQFPKSAVWHITQTFEARQNDWADYLRAAAHALSSRYPVSTGMCAVIDGDLPAGGVAGSSAVIITFLNAFCALNSVRLSYTELISVSREAENKYMGIACGRLDQSCAVYCKKNHLLYLDFADNNIELIRASEAMKPCEILIFTVGLGSATTGSRFNMRVDELRCAAFALKSYAGISGGALNETNMRDVPREVFEQYKNRLPDAWRRRAEHWYTEYDRVGRGADAWRRGDIEEFGRLAFESGHSSIYNWDVGSPELLKIYETMLKTSGIYGGRFSGAGFHGTCMAITDPSHRDEIIEQIEKGFTDAFPGRKEKPAAHVCHTADGLKW